MDSIGSPNPQIAFGADVLTRISACTEGALPALCESVTTELTSMVEELACTAGIDSRDITSVVLAGNTVMEHLAAGINPVPLGVAPFTPPTLFGTDVFVQSFADADLSDQDAASLTASDRSDQDTASLTALGDGNVFFAPCIAAYVGGDITCDLLALDMRHESELVLLIDLGTNGEMALGNSTSIMACATAAGPVFEGACIKYGMPAYEGAISHVWLENDELCYETIGDAVPVGICGTGLIDAIALMLDHGLIDETGALLDPDSLSLDASNANAASTAASIKLAQNLIEDDGDLALRIAPGIAITQRDVRQLQLAKAAISAGILTLLEERNVTIDDVDKLVIAGGFGSFLDMRNAARVGLFPPALLDRATNAGNLAIEGAGLMCLSKAAREEANDLARTCHYLELSTSATFNGFYVDEMIFEEADLAQEPQNILL